MIQQTTQAMTTFTTYDEAFDFCAAQNKAFKKSGSKEFVCVVPGHADNYAVVDHFTAINLGLGYVIAERWTANPWN